MPPGAGYLPLVTPRNRLSLAAAAAAGMLLLACSSTTAPSGKRLPILLANDDTASVYLLSQTETSSPGTLVAAGAARTIQLVYDPGNPLGAEFEAVRAGKQLDRVYCFARFTAGTLAPEVRWDGARLSCRKWG